jgi:hypothetical protein
MALARWDGMGWVYPASGGVALDFQPVEYYLPEGARA